MSGGGVVGENWINVPDELTAKEQWICWRNECVECGSVLDPSIKECHECGGKTTKRPINPNGGGFAKTDDPSTWATFESAVDFHEGADTHGIGFVTREDGDVIGIDLDDCRDPETEEIDDWALDIVSTLNSFTEVSPSGTGLHIYAFGPKPEGGTRRDGVEMYAGGQYLTISGREIDRSPGVLNYREDEIAAVHEGYIESASTSTVDVDVDLSGVEFTESKDTYENDLGETLEEIREQDPELDAALEEIQPGYDITDDTPSGYDASVVSKLWKRRFSTDDISKILYEYRSRGEGKLKRQDYHELTIEFAAGGERFDPRASEEVEILDERDQYRSIENAKLPETDNFALDKPPREGGSHASIDHLSEKPLVILASRHSICEHHLEILEKVMPDGKTAVHYVGSGRACRNGGDEDCPNVLGREDNQERNRVIHAAKDAIAENRIVTKEDSPDGICPSQFLGYVEEYCWAVVTVPNLLPNLSRDLPGNNLLIDEEQALSYFRPPSVDIATIETVYDPDGSRRVQASESNISSQLPVLRDICEQIFENRNQRSQKGKTDAIHRLDKEEDVLHAADYLKRAAQAMSIEDVTEDIGGSPTAGEVVTEIRDRLSEIPRPTPSQGTDEFRGGIEDYVERYYFSESVDPGAMIECTLFGYDDRKFDFKKTPGGYKLRMIGGRDVFHADKLEAFDQIGVIAGPEGELLFEDTDMDARVIDITDFEYADDFVIVPVAKEMDERMEPVADQRQRARKVSKILNRRAHPHIAVAGTKRQARNHHGGLVEGVADIISSPKTPSIDIDNTWTAGGTAIIYENSAVSRGIDAPQMDISVVASSGFATPYWEARKEHYKGEDDEEYEYAKGVERQLKAHELTNSVLRPSPTRYVDDITGTKFIVCADWDAPRVHYVDQEAPTFARAESAANFIEQLTIQGGIRREQELIHEQVGSEREYIETTMSEEFRERVGERPDYSAEELRDWVENGYLTGEGVIEKVRKRPAWHAGELEMEAVRSCFTWSAGLVSTALDVLHRKGIVSKRKEYPEGGGEAKLIWEWNWEN